MLTLSHCIGVVEHSELAPVFTAHSIGFVTLWMLANPFFGFVGPATMSEVLTLCALGVRDAYLTGLKSRSCPTEGDSSTHGLLGFLLTTPHRTSFCMLGLIGVGLVGFVSLSVAVPKEGFGNHRLTTIENAHSDEWGVQPTLWAYPQCRAAPAVQCVGALLIASATKGMGQLL